MGEVYWTHKYKRKEKLENLWLLQKSLFMYFQANNGNYKASIDFILYYMQQFYFLKVNIHKIS